MLDFIKVSPSSQVFQILLPELTTVTAYLVSSKTCEALLYTDSFIRLVLPSFYGPNSFQYFVIEDPHYSAYRVREKVSPH
jgi:hypothetical protein